MKRLFLSLVVVFLSCLAIAADLNAETAEDYVNRGDVWASKGENDKSIADYTEAIRLDPQFAIAYRRRGATWGRKGEYDKAITDLNEAIRINRKDATAYTTRGYNWSRKNEFDKAIADYTEAIRLDPKDAMPYISRAAAWVMKGKYDKTTADLNQALSVNPKYVYAYNGLAWLYATCPEEKYRDGKRAVENAQKAYELTEGKVCAILDTLAAAYAESGDFEKAKEWAAKAIEKAATDKSVTDKNKTELASRLELYKQGKPYHEEPKKVDGQGRASEDTRTWTAANGKFTVKATFVSSDTTKVKLKKEDETVITVALDRLSEEDQAWVQKRLKQ